MSTYSYTPLGSQPDPAVESELRSVLVQSFGFPEDKWSEFADLLGRENFRLLRRGSTLVGGLGQYPGGQYFGGQSIPASMVAAVGVAPEHRSGGVAFELMLQLLRELREAGTPLAVLYASTSYFYRKLGFEHAGASHLYKAKAANVGPIRSELEMTPVDPNVYERFVPMYESAARRSSGFIDRSPGMWKRVVRRNDNPIHAYIVGDPSDPCGYLIFEQSHENRLRLKIRDWCATKPEARRRMLQFLAGHRSLGAEFSWRGPSDEPVLWHMPEQETELAALENWLVRIIDVQAALEQRGYPSGQREELDLEVVDDVLPENTGAYRLHVAEGRASVTPGGSGSLELHIRGLGPLFTGFLAPSELHEAGLLTGTDESLETAARIFHGPHPWMSDQF